MLCLWLALAFAQEPELPLVEGFDRLLVDPDRLHVEPKPPRYPLSRGDLTIWNGTTARARVLVGEVPVGELLPKQTGILRDVLVGTYPVRFEAPDGAVREESIDAR